MLRIRYSTALVTQAEWSVLNGMRNSVEFKRLGQVYKIYEAFSL